ncbi:MAG: corrinoid protein [Planctomycetaceae bacterium]|jgi:5-methyltetrahydrofolate--homocysteine methyltransferase|nr:corrinoid protein [Planctomycetaceae bacterium]
MSRNPTLFDSVINGDMAVTVAEIQQEIDRGTPPQMLLEENLIPAMAEVGRLFEENEYFVPELLISARAMQEGMKLLNPLLTASGIEKAGYVVIGTVKGDLHDIGKNLVKSMLEGGGFEVLDLGVDVAPEKFVEEAKSRPGTIIALSALLTTTMPQMKNVIDALKMSGIRDSVKVMIGGAPVTEEYAQAIGADGYSDNASAAVQLAHQFV